MKLLQWCKANAMPVIAVLAAAVMRAPLAVGLPTAAYTVRLHKYKAVRDAIW